MPVQTEDMEDYKMKYKLLKRKLKILIYENECFQDELRKANKALLRVRQDKSFLLDQLLPYHHTPASSSDSDLTDCSDNEFSTQPPKRKRTIDSAASGVVSSSAVQSPGSSTGASVAPNRPPMAGAKPPSLPRHQSLPNTREGGAKQAVAGMPKKRASTVPANRQQTKQAAGKGSRQKRSPQKAIKNSHVITGDTKPCLEETELSREELERRLAARQPIADFSTPVSLTLPNQLFSDNIVERDGDGVKVSPIVAEDELGADHYE